MKGPGMDARKTEIAFRIGPDGSVTFDVRGVKGPDCLALTKELEEELGVVVARSNTAEFYEEEAAESEVVAVEEG